jgi:tetratricopeptide (TPR) repeat protein
MADKHPPAGPPGNHARRPGHAPATDAVDHRDGASRTRWAQAIGIGLGLAISAAVGVYLVRDPEDPPARQLESALRLLDEGRDQSARRIAVRLQEKGYQDPNFAGGVPFVLGICAFRDAGAHDDVTRDQRYMTAVGFLREAARLSLPDERRPEWAFAAGISLQRTGFADEAQPLLEEAVQTYAPGKHEAGLTVTQIYMDGRTRENLEHALAVNDQLVADATLRPADRDNAWLQRAQILLSLGRRQESEEALENVSRDGRRTQGIAVLRAQSMMVDGKLREALKTLDPLSRDVGLDQAYPAQAQYLMGACAEQLGEIENAVVYYQRTAERFEQTHEALAARLGAAAGLRKLGRNEEALENYALVLRSVPRPRSFRNRWVSLKKLQDTVVEAWNSWMENHYYDEAIALADIMSPVIPREQALELAARASQRWAQYLDGELAKLPLDRESPRQAEVELRWKRSGQAFARLAENRRSAVEHFNALWTSAEDYIKGRDFENAIAILDQFVAERTSNLLPTALVRRGQCLMNIGRLDDALRDFQEAIASAPTDPVAFQARLLIGQCHLEHDEIDQAERTWRMILESTDLTPTALEWRTALYSLGKLLYETAEIARRKSAQVVLTGQNINNDQQAQALARFDDAILRLEEFRDRYPSAAETAEVRFLLARALQKSAEFPEARWKSAETETARSEYRRQMQERLERAIHELQGLQTLLLGRQASGQLDPPGQVRLRNCFFEIANCNFMLGRYEAAIAAYSTSAGRYQHEPDSLSAYVQIANCYDRMQRPAEALSTLAQAQLILKQLPDDAFLAEPSAMSRDDWQRWLDWSMKLHN